MKNIDYRPDIDGLRAFAVLPVILFHLGFNWMKGGFVGVDVFFVISGYLITGIIYKQLKKGSFSIIDFWGRRIRRLVPALLTVLLVTLLAGVIVLFSTDQNSLGRQAIATMLSLANVEMWKMAGDYWGANAERAPLLHMWSLAVEEQFYLFYPFALLLMHKMIKRGLIYVLGCVCLLSFCFSWYASIQHPSAAFYMLPFRAWELGVGGIIALFHIGNAHVRVNAYISTVASFLGLSLLIISYAYIDQDSGFPAPLGLLPVIGASLIIGFPYKEGLVYRLLSLPLNVLIGKWSYSLYLWHWPVIVLSSIYTINTQKTYSVVFVSLIFTSLAVLTYYAIENPMRKSTKSLKWLVAPVIIVVSLAVYLLKNDKQFDISYQNKTVWKGEYYDCSPFQDSLSDQMVKRMIGIECLPREDRPSERYKKEGVVHYYNETKKIDVVLFGSSHALMWCGVLDEICRELSLNVSFFAANATPAGFEVENRPSNHIRFTSEQKQDFDTARKNLIKTHNPSLVIVVECWSRQEDDDPSRVALFKFLEEQGTKTLLLEQPPYLSIGDINATQFAAYLDAQSTQMLDLLCVPLEYSEEWHEGKQLIEKWAASFDNIESLSFDDLYYMDSKGLLREDKNLVYIDDDHLSEYGARKAKSEIRTFIQHFLKDESDIHTKSE